MALTIGVCSNAGERNDEDATNELFLKIKSLRLQEGDEAEENNLERYIHLLDHALSASELLTKYNGTPQELRKDGYFSAVMLSATLEHAAAQGYPVLEMSAKVKELVAAFWNVHEGSSRSKCI
jgi:hypothetical protein